MVAAYVDFHCVDGRGNTGTMTIRLGASGAITFADASDLTVAINKVEVEALRDAVFGADKLANVDCVAYSIRFVSADTAPIVANSSPISSYWKVVVPQGTEGADTFTFKIPGARLSGALYQTGSGTLANLSAEEWVAVKAILEATPFDITNPDKDIAPVTQDVITGAQMLDARRTPPRENVGK